MNKVTIEDRIRIFKHVPAAYNWAAKDEDGRWFCFLEKPMMLTHYPMWWHVTALQLHNDAAHGVSIDWRESLITRPTNEEIKNIFPNACE